VTVPGYCAEAPAEGARRRQLEAPPAVLVAVGEVSTRPRGSPPCDMQPAHRHRATRASTASAALLRQREAHLVRGEGEGSRGEGRTAIGTGFSLPVPAYPATAPAASTSCGPMPGMKGGRAPGKEGRLRGGESGGGRQVSRRSGHGDDGLGGGQTRSGGMQSRRRAASARGREDTEAGEEGEEGESPPPAKLVPRREGGGEAGIEGGAGKGQVRGRGAGTGLVLVEGDEGGGNPGGRMHSFKVSGTVFKLDRRYEMIRPIGTGAYGVVM
jgi:hypothetical protein